MTQAIRRSRTRAAGQLDMSRFRHTIDQAMEAFEADVSYAVQMARAAVTITRKREVWQERDARAR